MFGGLSATVMNVLGGIGVFFNTRSFMSHLITRMFGVVRRQKKAVEKKKEISRLGALDLFK